MEIHTEFKYDEEEEFRDSLATVTKEGKRIWMYPKMPSGKFFDYRQLVSYFLLAILLIMPWIKVNGYQFMLLNVVDTKFVLFGFPFYPQDFFMFAVAMITMVVFVILFTVIFGRVFCGWVCPQTIFMEMVYRRIEYWIEGDYTQQKKLNSGPWTSQKVFKKTLKHIFFFGIAVVIANTFLSYIISSDEVWKIITSPVSDHLTGFIAMLIFSGVFYGVFSFLREQVCTTVCPYGRLQSVMLDKNSIVISYDWIRGEPRGKLKKQTEAAFPLPVLGDCIDCNLCVKVCPTGIDIRNGTQLECVNCTACIDACDEVMVKVNKPTGLIRYDSYNGIEQNKRQLFTARSIAYSVLLGILLLVNMALLVTRKDIDVIIMRTPGQLYHKVNDGDIRNLYNYQIVNKSNKEKKLSMSIEGLPSAIKLIGYEKLVLPPDTVISGTMFITIPLDRVSGKKTDLTIDLNDGKSSQKIKTSFFGPNK
jgi:cytochrome c oxidase accessory protein FixG